MILYSLQKIITWKVSATIDSTTLVSFLIYVAFKKYLPQYNLCWKQKMISQETKNILMNQRTWELRTPMLILSKKKEKGDDVFFWKDLSYAFIKFVESGYRYSSRKQCC